jgi:DNA-3-methyladenine glycosylase
MTRPIPRSFYVRDPLEVAPELLGKLIVHGERSARIVEVEAYRGALDPASHARRGMTPRNRVMFGPPGHWYVYFTYGMHWCANVVCWPEGEAAAVLIRAALPVAGLEAMYAARPVAKRDIDLCSGPAKLCQALGVDGTLNGSDAVNGTMTIVDDGTTMPTAIDVTGRVGVSDGAELPWRWLVAGDPNVSRGRVIGRSSMTLPPTAPLSTTRPSTTRPSTTRPSKSPPSKASAPGSAAVDNRDERHR